MSFLSLRTGLTVLFLALDECASVDDAGSVDGAGELPPSTGRDATSSGGVDAGKPRHGFRADWFDLFSTKKLTRVERTAAISHDAATAPAPGLRGVLYSVRWTARIRTSEGEHAFFVEADDGARVFVDEQRVIDDWKAHPAKESTGRVSLRAGEHLVRVEYFQAKAAAKFALEWQPPGGARGPIAESALTPLEDPPTDAEGGVLEGPRPLFSNPVVAFDCPDPGVIAVPGEHLRFAMVCTGGAFPVRVSDDLVTWRTTQGSIVPGGKASWSANGGRNWAPEIHRVGAKFVAYYTAVNGANRLSIGCASAPAPEGPYADCGKPMVEHPLGVIDATYFGDSDGKHYLYYKIDGNSVGQRTPIFVRELAADGLSFAPGSTQVEVLNNDPGTWERGVVEAPWVVKRGADYFMFYSGNVYDDRYRTGVARAKSPKGPFTKKGAPILGNNAKWVGPGHGTVLRVHERDYFFHHAWPALPDGKHDVSKGRFGLLAPITWDDEGWPSVGGSSVTTQMLWP